MRTRRSEAKSEPLARKMFHLAQKNLDLARTLQILEEARTSLADQYDYAPLGFVTLDGKGCIRQVNITAAQMVGHERSGLISRPFFTLVAERDCQKFMSHLRECRASEGEVISEMTLRDGRSGRRPVELRSVPVLDLHAGGTVYRTIITDISERLRADTALRESEGRYRDLAELSPDGIFIVSEGTIVFANPAALKLCQVEQARGLLGSDFIACVRPSFRPAVEAALHGETANAHAAPFIEAQLTRRSGAPVEVELAMRGFRHDGQPATLVMARDISRRRRAERHVLKISERERTTFGQDVHDSLCQSLTGAGFLADVLRRRLQDSEPEIAEIAGDVARVIRQCGDEARTLARGLCPVNMERHGLTAALQTLSADVTARSQVACSLECDERLTIADASVATNVFRIAQEAVSNAIKHASAKSVLIQLIASNGRIHLRVRDDGKGIPASPKRSGMGLYTMDYRATMIGGSLEVRRIRPRGTMVACSFPAHQAK